MKKERVILSISICVLILLVILIGIGYKTGIVSDIRQKAGIVIGVVLPLSGSMAEYGENGRNGLILASKELSVENGFKNIKLVYQDSGGTAPGTVNAVKRLVDADGAKYIIGGLTSSGVLAALPTIKQHGVFFFTPAASAPGIPDGRLVFRNWPSDDALAGIFGRVAYKTLGARNVAILHVSNDYGKTNADTFSNSFRAAGGKVLLTRAFPQGATDFKALITQISSQQDIDTLFLVAYPDEYRGLFQEIAIKKLNKRRILVSDTFYSPQLLSDIGTVADGAIVAVAAKPGKEYEPRQRFIKAYQREFGKEPGLVSDTAYDALHLVYNAIKNTDGSPQSVGGWLRNLKDYRGAAGVVNFTETGDIRADLSILQVVNGKFEDRRF